ncbi:MAG: GNAT family N-acetyltransferase [Ornithinimicrobium sp.]
MTSNPPTPPVLRASFGEMSVHQLYAVLRLRVDVFVVEQQCPYAELDGLDAEPGTEHLWIEDAAADDNRVVATLRILSVHGGYRIGRVATARSHRGRGYAATLMRAALDSLADAEIALEAQAHLEQWYAGYGFARAGANYLEDGIAHVPMHLSPGSEAAR